VDKSIEQGKTGGIHDSAAGDAPDDHSSSASAIRPDNTHNPQSPRRRGRNNRKA
jgi:hypothetical protein